MFSTGTRTARLRAAQLLVCGHRGLPGERRVVGALALQQLLQRPDRADAEDVAHLVGDDVVEGAVRLHLLQVVGVERHDPLGRQQRRRS